jgi:hypothetical protein
MSVQGGAARSALHDISFLKSNHQEPVKPARRPQFEGRASLLHTTLAAGMSTIFKTTSTGGSTRASCSAKACSDTQHMSGPPPDAALSHCSPLLDDPHCDPDAQQAHNLGLGVAEMSGRHSECQHAHHQLRPSSDVSLSQERSLGSRAGHSAHSCRIWAKQHACIDETTRMRKVIAGVRHQPACCTWHHRASSPATRFWTGAYSPEDTCGSRSVTPLAGGMQPPSPPPQPSATLLARQRWDALRQKILHGNHIAGSGWDQKEEEEPFTCEHLDVQIQHVGDDGTCSTYACPDPTWMRPATAPAPTSMRSVLMFGLPEAPPTPTRPGRPRSCGPLRHCPVHSTPQPSNGRATRPSSRSWRAPCRRATPTAWTMEYVAWAPQHSATMMRRPPSAVQSAAGVPVRLNKAALLRMIQAAESRSSVM